MRLRVFAAVAGVVSLVAGGVAIGDRADAQTDTATEFTPGSGFAQASLLTPSLNAGELRVPIVLGEAGAGFQDETGRATSTTLTIPLLAAAAGAGQVCGVAGGGLSVPLPDPLYADTSSTNNKKPVDQVSGDKGSAPMYQEVHAKPKASGTSSTQFLDMDLPGVVAVGGAVAKAETTADFTKNTRLATATTDVADIRILDGLVTIKGAKWVLTQSYDGLDSRTRKAKETHTFTFDGISLNPTAGLPLPIPKISIPIATPAGAASAVKTINTLLEPVGLTIHLPTFDDNGKGRLTMTPLVFQLGGPNWLATPILGGILSQQQLINLQTNLFKFLFDPKDCAQLFGLMKAIPPVNAKYNSLGNTAPLLVAAAMGVLSGGSTTVSIGGVATALDDTYFAPFNFGGPAQVQSGTNNYVPPTPGTPGRVIRRPGQVQAFETSSKTSKCHTSSPAGKPGCWRGLAPLAAAAAGVVAIGSLVADEVSTRRRVARLARNEIA